MITIVVLKDRYWGVAQIFIDDKKVREINRFFTVKDDAIYEYEADGGSGFGYNHGNLIWKLPIGDHALQTFKLPDDEIKHWEWKKTFDIYAIIGQP